MSFGFRNWTWAALVSLALSACGGASTMDMELGLEATGEHASDQASTEAKVETSLEVPGPMPDGIGGDVSPELPRGEDSQIGVDVPLQPGDPGYPCQTDNDCNSDFCIVTPDGKKCTTQCTEECPFGWACVQDEGSLPDVVSICAPTDVTLCRPCQTNDDCDVNNVATAVACVHYGGAGDYCATVCSDSEPCPKDYYCLSATDASGAEGHFCVRMLPDCQCTQLFANQGATTACYVENEAGKCLGTRGCSADGLSECSAAAPQMETCNGQDDNCDGKVDEGTGGEECFHANANGVCVGVKECIGGTLECNADTPEKEACDGKDNNCSGTTDEEFPDSDGDGIADCLETDKDGDGVADIDDNCPYLKNELQEDFDFDGKGDACDLDDDNDLDPDVADCKPLDPLVHAGAAEECDGKDNDCDLLVDEGFVDSDSDKLPDCLDEDDDGDGAPDDLDCKPLDPKVHPGAPEECNGKDENCDGIPDEGFPDSDGDGIADCAEGDTDGDGVEDFKDNCLLVPNGGQEDQDQDGAGDVCDPDKDGDGIPNALDNCVSLFNPIQSDLDLDQAGDPCDDDMDGDGLANADDNCPAAANPDQEDFDLDLAGDPCDSDDDGDGDLDVTDCGPLDPDVNHQEIEVCDGQDNNCILGTDEGYTDTDQDGFKDCADGDDDGDGTVDALDCKPLDPKIHPGVPEACDGLDNNCNKLTDEGFATIDCGKGECLHKVSLCSGGKPGICNPFEGASVELCDALDNDCDGNTDEGFPLGKPCTVGLGECQTSGSTVCAEDGEGTVCPAEPLPPAPEECDGKDNDCDGKTDNGLGTSTCGQGACTHTVENCVGGQLQACDPFAGAAKEKCNGLDDDCNGKADDPWTQLGKPCVVGLGECAGQGVYVCKGDQAGVACDGEPVPPTPETCDSLDNDCNGKVDDGLGTSACGQGVCLHQIANCLNGQAEACDPLEGAGDEICNGLDDDCDGLADEELGSTTCGQGPCTVTVENCVGGQPQLCVPLPGQAEVCDTLDNDCDGVADQEGAVGCANWFKDLDSDGHGDKDDFKCLCSAAGPYLAPAGGDCNDGDATINPGVKEICFSTDGKDNDCNGKADDNLAIRFVRMGYSDWDDPNAHGNLQAHLQALGYTVTLEGGQTLGNIPNLAKVDLLWLHGHNSFGFSADERQLLKQYLTNGGMLWTDDCNAGSWGGVQAFTSSVMAELMEIFGTNGEYVPDSHPIYSSHYALGALPTTEWSGESKALGITLAGELATILTVHDFGCGLNNEGNGTTNSNSRNIGTNIAVYAARKKCQ